MALSNIRTAIKTTIETVANVGVVNDFEPHATRQEDFKTYFKHASLAYIQGWTITRESTPVEVQTNVQNLDHHLMVIRGYRALDQAGATERDFQDLIESVRVKLRAEQKNLYGLGSEVFVGPPSVRIAEPRMFGGFLVHYCEITQQVSELVNV